MEWTRRRALMLVGLLVSVSAAGCSLNRMAVNKIGDALAGSGTTFSSDDDPDLVGQAIPFSLKLIESLLASAPEHRGLLLAASSGFTKYAFAWVQLPADTLEEHDLAAAMAERARVVPAQAVVRRVTRARAAATTTAGTAATPNPTPNGTPDVHSIVITGNMPAGQPGTNSTGIQTDIRTVTITY